MDVLPAAAVDGLIAALEARGYVVIGPTVRDGAVVLDEVHGRADLPVGVRDWQAPGYYRLSAGGEGGRLFDTAVGPDSFRRWQVPVRRRLWSAVRTDDGGFEVADEADERPPVALFGARACDLAAMAVQDGIFGLDDDRFVVAVNCGRPASTCFCASTGTGPGVVDGFDIALTELADGRLLAEAGRGRGAEVLADVPSSAATDADVAEARSIVAQAAATHTRALDPATARDALRAALASDRWDDVADRCLGCGNCTLVCPTCFCNRVEDLVSLDGRRAERVQRWDSCFSPEHSYIHGVGPVRPDIASRYRQWLTHKLSTWWDQFGTSGCVGCGRCITWCPAGIDFVAEATR